MGRPLDEPILDDQYPVYAGYLYVADGKLISSNIAGTVRRLKATLGAKEIRRCDYAGRVSEPYCVECGQYYADPPSSRCPGCQAYREHQA